MTTPDLKLSYKDLEQRVNELITKNPVKFAFNSVIKSDRIYYFTSILIFIALIIFRPDFVYDEDEKKEKKLKWNKILVYWVIFTVIVSTGIFGYNYKYNQNF